MKQLSTYCTIGFLALAALVTGCSNKKGTAGSSPKTGWKYNDKYNGGFHVSSKIKSGPGPGLITIEGGTFVMGGSLDQDLAYEYDNIRKRVTIASFYMDETEVSNVDWLEYMYWISRTYPGDREVYYNAVPDTLVWRQPLSYNEPYVTNYLRHPAFQDYPVVGVSWDQAKEYCDWRTQRVNEQRLRERGILVDFKTAAGKGKGGGAPAEPFHTDLYTNGQQRGEGFDGKNMPKDLNPNATANGKGAPTRVSGLEDGVLLPPYRLPTEAEWEYSALALVGNTEYENISDGKIYPWSGLGVRSSKKATQGLIAANFKRGQGDNMGVGGSLNDKADITAPVRSYLPNDFGLYNMAGNVNEWVEDTYRKLSFEDFEDFNPFRGNQFVDKRLDDPKSGKYAKDKYGRPIKDPAKSARKQSWAELNGQTDSTVTTSTEQAPAKALTGKAYNPDFRGELDTVNQALYGVTTLVNNRSKVYKGGSWNDRAYWLNPATRRFMDQAATSAEVGFRCAMGMVGAPEVTSNKGKARFIQPRSKAPRSKS